MRTKMLELEVENVFSQVICINRPTVTKLELFIRKLKQQQEIFVFDYI